MDNQSYWARRQMEREAQWHDLTTEELRKLKRYYVKAAADIERDIAALYAKYATENGLTMTAARKLIRGDEFKSWRLTLEEYVRKSKVDPKILRELNTLTARSRISRLEALHARTLMETIDLAERLQEAADAHLARAYLETYYGNLYDFHKTIGLSTPPNAVDAKRVESVLQTAWVGKNYSSRIWANQAKLANELEATMLQAIHRGSSIQQLSKALSRRMDVAYSNAERLIRTELNAVENRASAAAMKAAEFTHYQFMATLDRRTCARCGERDGEVYKLSEMNQGENAPPMHARCRCTIVAYDGLQYGTRAARDFGDSVKGKSVSLDADESGDKKIKTPFGEVNGTKVKITLSNGEVVDHYRRVPADMSYRDWKAIYIDKSKSLETWQAEFDARRKSDEQSPLRQRGRAIIDKFAAGDLPKSAPGGKVTTDEVGAIRVIKRLTPAQIKEIRDAEDAAFWAKTDANFGFDKMRSSFDWVKEITSTNPPDKIYGHTPNCQRCVVAHEARMRGYDVIARPSWGLEDTLRNTGQWLKAFDYSPTDFKQCIGSTGDEVLESATEIMRSFGEGSRAIIVFKWDKTKINLNDGHAIVAQCREHGAVIFGDPQHGNRAAAHKLKLSNLDEKIILLRVDNLEFTDIVKRCCRNRREYNADIERSNKNRGDGA